MRGTAQARIVAANHGLDTIQHARSEVASLDKVLGYLQHTAVHGQVIVPGSNHEIHPADQALLVNLVVMKESAARSFAGPNTFERIGPGQRADVLGENLWIVQQLLQPLDAVNN